MLLAPQLFLFIILVFVVALARTRLIHELSANALLIFNNVHLGQIFYAVLTFPGTVLHELSHWLVAEILGVRTGEISVLPRWNHDQPEHRLGSVMTAHTDPLRGFLIGIAPFVTGISALIFLGYLLESWWGIAPLWQLALVVYGLVVIGNSMTLSRADRRFWPLIAILTTIITLALFISGITLPPQMLTTAAAVFLRINQALGLTIALNLAIIGIVRGVRFVLEWLTGRKIDKRS